MAANRQLEEKDFEKFLKGVPTSTDGGIKGDVDVFNGVTIGPEHLVDMTYERLKKQLPLALKTWLEEGKRGIWIKIPTNQSELISIATNVRKYSCMLCVCFMRGVNFLSKFPLNRQKQQKIY
jgi:hypothetical protein